MNITVYEKSDYVGGRSTCKIKVNDQVIQIAARGFHASNKNLVDAVRSLRLTPVMLDGKGNTDLSGRSGDHWGVYVSRFLFFFLFWRELMNMQLLISSIISSTDMTARHSSIVRLTPQIFCRPGGGTPS